MGSERSSGFAVIVAAGSGRRFGGKKQNTDINGHPMYWHSLKAFDDYGVKQIVIVVNKEDADSINTDGIKTPVKAVPGGSERFDSVWNGIQAIEGAADEDIILIHDGARPGITVPLIERVVNDTVRYGAAAASVPVVDTIRTVARNGMCGDIVDRNTLRAMQTPQSFKYGILNRAFTKFMDLPIESRRSMKITDDVQVVERMLGIKSYLSEGDVNNIKVTIKDDIKRLT